MKDYSHEVSILQDQNLLEIYRVGQNGDREFYTSVELPKDESGLGDFAKMLGENILLDSPAFRSVFRI